jgi:hypothetical protein
MYPTIWVVNCSDNFYVMDGIALDFLHSVHRTRKGAEAEARKQRRIARRMSARVGCKVTLKYTIVKQALLP